MKIANTLDLWLKIGRSYTLPQTILPYIFAVVLAAKNYDVNYFLSFLGLIGVCLAHMSVNMLDDYFDWKKGAVQEYKKLSEQGIVAITHKCFYLEQNSVTPKKVLTVALIYGLIAFLFGLFIALKVGLSVVIIALFTAALGFFYSAPPIRLSYRGLGEPVIGIIFGPLLMSGAYITAGARLDVLILVSSVMVGILVANIAFAHAIMDFDSDLKVGKTSFATLFKTKINAIKVLAFLYFLTYAILAVATYAGIYPPETILVFATAPMTVGLVKLMQNDDKEKKFWMGVIENWEQLQKEGTDWFMMRLLITRNIVVHFIVMLGIIYYLLG